MMRATTLAVLLGAGACTASTTLDDTDDSDVVDSDTDSPWHRPDGGTIVFDMPDGVTVPADYYPASAQGRPAVLLMACSSPTSSRKDWPDEVVEHFTERDISVLIPDFRGCGESTGSINQIRTGLAVLDVRTYVNRLYADGYGHVSVVTGTATSAATNAYTYQENLASRPLPASITYLTPNAAGPERLVSMELMPVLPSLFLITSSDVAWGREMEGFGNGEWEFHYYGRSGLDMELFEVFPESIDHLFAFHDRLWDGG